MFNINNNYVYEYNLYLCNMDKSIICQLDYIDLDITFNFRQYDELSFEVPLTDMGWRKIENKYFNYLQPLYLILMEVKSNDDVLYQEYFIVDSPSFNYDNGVTKKTIKCYSSDYEFNNFYLNSYEAVKVLYDEGTTYGGDGVLNTMLNSMENTWQVNFMSSTLKGVYHSYNFSSNTYRSVIESLSEQFNCYFVFDTVNNYINIYDATTNELGINTNIIISDENYLKSLSCDIKNSEMVTCLRAYGKDNLTCVKFNPRGTIDIRDYSWFQENGRMSSSLSTAYTNWLNLISSNETTFQGYLSSLDSLQSTLNTYNSDLKNLNTQLETISDILQALKDNNKQTTSEYTTNIVSYKSKQSEITVKKVQITSIENQMTVINNNITTLNNTLSINNNFTSAQRKDLSKMTITAKLNLSSVTDAKQLYEYSVNYLKLKNKPTYDIDLNIVDLYDLNDEYLINNISKLRTGNFIIVDCASLGTEFDYVSYRITKINHKPLSNSLTITISNKDKVNSDINYLNKIFTTSATAAETLTTNQSSYSAYSNNVDSILTDTSVIDTSTNTIQTSNNTFINKRGWQGTSLSGTGAIQVCSDRIVFSQDNWDTFYTMISSEGIYLETPDSLSRFVLTPSHGLQLDTRSSTTNSWGNALYVGYTNGVPSIHIDNGYLSLSGTIGTHSTNILLNPTVGIKVTNDTKDVFYVDQTTGNIVCNDLTLNNMTAQGTISGSTISGSEIRGSTFYNTSKTGWIIINQDATNYADFTFGVDTSTLPLLKLYNNTTSCNWLTLNHEFLRTTSSQALPQGSWNFSNSTVTGLIGYATSSDITTLYNYINMNFQPKA